MALGERGQLDHANVTQAVFKALDLKQEAYAIEPAEYGPGKDRNERAMLLLLEYRLYEDLRRGRRIVQPNLEQCGLLCVEYPGISELCQDDEKWSGHPVLKQASHATRENAAKAFLDHLRREMAIDARVLDPAEEWELRHRVEQNLRDPWAFDSDDPIRHSSLFVLPGGNGRGGERDRRLGDRSALGRYLRRRDTWGLKQDIPAADWEALLNALANAPRKGGYLRLTKTHTQQEAVQLPAGSFIWKLGDGTPAKPDRVRSRWMRSPQLEQIEREANRFFAELYIEKLPGC